MQTGGPVTSSSSPTPSNENVRENGCLNMIRMFCVHVESCPTNSLVHFFIACILLDQVLHMPISGNIDTLFKRSEVNECLILGG